MDGGQVRRAGGEVRGVAVDAHDLGVLTEPGEHRARVAQVQRDLLAGRRDAHGLADVRAEDAQCRERLAGDDDAPRDPGGRFRKGRSGNPDWPAPIEWSGLDVSSG